MLFRKFSILFAISIFASILFTGTARCDNEDNKAKMLVGFVQSTQAQLPARISAKASESPQMTAQLTLDLIVYRWTSRLSKIPPDVKNINQIISSLSKTLKNQTADWAMAYFPTVDEHKSFSQMPERDDERVQALSDLSIQVKSALDYKESAPIEAVKSLQNAIQICQQLGLDLTEALLLKSLGDHYLYDMTRYRQAEICYDRATWVFSAYGCVVMSAGIYDDWGTLSEYTGRFSNAIENYTQAARQWERLASQSSNGLKYRDLAGQEYIKAGDIQMSTGDADMALQLMNTGLDQLRIWAQTSKSYDSLISNLIKVSDSYIQHGDVTKALKMLQGAQMASSRQPDMLLTAQLMDELSKAYTAANQPQNAAAAELKRNNLLKKIIFYGELALTKIEKYPAISADKRSVLAGKIGYCAEAYQETQNYSKSAQVWQKLADIYESMRSIQWQISCLRSAAGAYDLSSNSQGSIAARTEAVKIAMSARQKSVAADIIQDMAQAFIAADDLPNALEAFTELAPIISDSGNVRGLARVLEARGKLLYNNGKYSDAIEDFQDARLRYSSQIGDDWGAGNVSLQLAQAQKALGKLTDARDTLKSALDDVESKYASENIDTNANSEHNRLLMNLYHDLASIDISLGDTDTAYRLLRHSRRYGWVSNLISQMKGDPDNAISSLAAKIDLLTGAETVNPSVPGSGKILADNWTSFVQNCWRLGRHYQANYNALPIDPLDICKLHESLPEKEAVVEYMVADSSTYAFVCSRNKVICTEISIQRTTIDASLAKLQKTLKDCEESLGAGIPVPAVNDWQELTFMEIESPLSDLYKQFIAPIKPELNECDGIIFVLPQELTGLPMHSLLYTNADESPHFLIEDYKISYLGRGMLSDITNSENKPIDVKTDKLSIFADPEGNLPDALVEAKEIQKSYPNSQSFTGNKANTSNFIRECGTSEILHVAAHHKTDSSQAGFQLLLAPDKDSDGSLGIAELSSVSKTALKMVVLSTCDSMGSSNPISNGQSRAAEVFSLLGADSIVGGLWKVSDAASAELMGTFYKEICNTTKAEALRKAQIQAIESRKFTHPFYWACFALYGNPN